MKKKYIYPETEVVELEERLPLLAGSLSDDLGEEPIPNSNYII